MSSSDLFNDSLLIHFLADAHNINIVHVDYYNKYICRAGPPFPPIQSAVDPAGGPARLSMPSDEAHHAWLVGVKAYWAAFVIPHASTAATVDPRSRRIAKQRLAQQRLDRSNDVKARLRATIKLREYQLLHAAAALHAQDSAHKAEGDAFLAVVDSVADTLDAVVTCSGCRSHKAQYSLHYMESAQHTLCDACIANHASKLDGRDWSWQYCPSCSRVGQWHLTSLTSNPAFTDTVDALSRLQSILPPDPYANTSAPLPPPFVSALDAGAIAHALQNAPTIDLDGTASDVTISDDDDS